MGSFMNIVVTSSPFGPSDKKGLTYLAVTNADYLPYLID